MKIKSLLAAVSMVALTAGSASALSIPTAASTAATGSNDVGQILTPEGAVLANELALPADGIGNAVFAVQTDTGTYPAGNNFNVLITLPSGVEVDGPINGSVLSGLYQDPGNATPTDRTDDVFAAGSGSATVLNQSGNLIELFVSIPQSGDATSALVFDLPLTLANCAVSGDLSVRVQTENGNDVENPSTATAPSPIAPCESAFDTSFDPDADDTVIGLTDYEQLKDTPGGGLVLTSTIGLYDALIDTMVGVDLAGTALTPASIDEVAFDICIEDGANVTDITVNGVSGTASMDGNTYSFALPFTADLTDAIIDITVDGADPIPSQSVTVKNVLHDFTDAGGPDLIGSEAGAGGALDTLQREGQEFGVFDWNSGQSGAQNVNVYRITGLDAGATVPYTISIENAGLTGAANTLTGSVTADAAGEAVLTDVAIAAMLPATVKRFDFGINLETGNDVDIDRLMTNNGVVSAFNDGANRSGYGYFGGLEQPGTDSDNTGSE